jgi:hypothetical protein
MWLRFIQASSVILALCVGASASVADVLDEIAGTYRIPAVRCSTMDSNSRLVSCEHEVQDCLTVKKVSPDAAWIQFISTQTNGHECFDEGTARLIDGALLYCPVNPDYGKQCVRIEIGKGSLLMKLIGGEATRDAFCGARATVTGLAFPRNARTKVERCNG